MKPIVVEVPDQLLAATHQGAEEFLQDMKLTAAVSWYSKGKLSQEMAAKLAGMDRTDFLLALARIGVDSFPVDLKELEHEFKRD